jgi:small ligand-binding sensory domain FIST
MSQLASAGIADGESLAIALDRAFELALQSAPANPQCAVVFVSGHDLDQQQDSVQRVFRRRAEGLPVFGGSAESVIGTGHEIERTIAASVLLLGGSSEPFEVIHLECMNTPDGPAIFGLDDAHSERAERTRGMMIVACPKTFEIDMLAERFAWERSTSLVPILGGYCSSQNWNQPNLLFCNDSVHQRGAVGLLLPSDWHWKTLVSQGCRPIGEPMIVTALEGDRLLGLGGRPALTQLHDMFRRLPNHEQALAIDALLIGRAIDEYSDTFEHGDFLIRNVQGVDESAQAVVVTDRFQVGQTVRFHVRDAATADADLNTLLGRGRKQLANAEACMLISCNGRGKRMFGRPHHDSQAIQEVFPATPVSGFFAAGEFAPIGRRNLTHGFTAVAAFLCRNSS